MQEKKNFNMNALSEHIFWDVDCNKLDIDKNFKFILQRILSYGLLQDWNLFYKSFGIEKIAEATKQIRNLDERSLHFIAHISGSSLNEFKCYTTKQSIPKHWHF